MRQRSKSILPRNTSTSIDDRCRRECFPRALISPQEPYNRWMYDETRDLLLGAGRGEYQLLATTAVIAEVVYVLTSKANYGLSAAAACALLEPILRIDQLLIEEKPRVMRALSIWLDEPSLGFVDSLVAAMAERPGDVLATFDKGFDRLPHLPRFAWKGRETADQ